MVNANLVTSKLADLTERLERVRKHRTAGSPQLAADSDARDLVAFNLMLAVQAAADIASHIIADEGLSPAPTLAVAFTRLVDHGVISVGTAAALAKAVGLRNVVAHGYAGIDLAMLHVASTTGLADLEGFGREVATWLLVASAAKS